MQAQTLWHIDSNQSLIRSSDLRICGRNECLIRAHYSMISLGTERLVSRGGIPVQAYQTMKVPYMEGEFSFPLTYGYSLTGEVVDGPREWIGERVHCMHPHQDLCIVHTADLYVIPEQVPLDRAVLASNLETAINAVWDGQPMVGQRILVIGYGLIGALLAYLLNDIKGIDLEVLDVNPDRLELVRKHGLSGFDQLDSSRLPYDQVYHTSATEAGLQNAIDWLMPQGKVIELSWFGLSSIRLNLGSSFHFDRKQIISSQVSTISPSAHPQWDHLRRKHLVFRLLEDQKLQDFLGTCIPFEEAPEFFQQLRNQSHAALNAYIQYI